MEKTKGRQMRTLRIMQVVFLVLFLSVAGYCLWRYREIDVETLVSMVSSNLVSAGAVMLLLYALKPLIVVVPIPVLYAASGLLFPLWVAIPLNAVGIALCIAGPYVAGRFYGMGLLDWVLKKYPKAQQLDELKRDNEFFFVYLVKLIGIIPCDISSMVLGAMRVKVFNCLAGSVLGMVPYMIAVTYFGDAFDDPFSWQFYASFGLVIVLSVVSWLLYRYVIKRKKPAKDTREEGQE